MNIADFPRSKDRLVLPLDVPDLATATDWVHLLGDEVGVFKVGLQLFTAAGPSAVEAVHGSGAACFLDLKLHDIPATMEHATRSAVELGVRYLTIHSSAGRSALERCARAVEGSETQLLAVSVLTSLTEPELREVGVMGTPEELVLSRAQLVRDCGVQGLVCSPLECQAIRANLGRDLTLMVPGIRPAGADAGDQKRIATPRAAMDAGADLLVVGRPIRQADDPIQAARNICDEITEALA